MNSKSLKIWAASQRLIDFTTYTKKEYQVKWFHRLLASKLDGLLAGKYKRLMVFMPPQHGKSELVSRRFPAFCLGVHPNLNIAVCSYSQSLAMQFNRETQRIIDDSKYVEIFPETRLSKLTAFQTSEIKRTASEFETSSFGKLISVGVGSGLTGRTVDIGIIDDPVKDAIEAYSTTYRERAWDWYLNVFLTRLHNESKVLLTMTRWHQDDLAGRILLHAQESGEEWEILILPAIKEDERNPIDIREIGETLWPEKHSLEKILKVKKISPTVYNSLYQQAPAAQDGNKIKPQWIRTYSMFELINKTINEDQDLVWDFCIDGAYTKDPKNDATGLLAFARVYNNIYIRDAQNVRLEMPELLNYIPSFCITNGYSKQSRIWIEPKASGLSVAQMLREKTSLNIVIDRPPTASKETRVDRCIPFYESQRLFVLEAAAWVESYLYELKVFPNSNIDNLVDCTSMAIDKVEITKEMEIFGFTAI